MQKLKTGLDGEITPLAITGSSVFWSMNYCGGRGCFFYRSWELYLCGGRSLLDACCSAVVVGVWSDISGGRVLKMAWFGGVDTVNLHIGQVF